MTLEQAVRKAAESLWNDRFPNARAEKRVAFEPAQDLWAVEMARVVIDALGLTEEHWDFLQKNGYMGPFQVRLVTPWTPVEEPTP